MEFLAFLMRLRSSGVCFVESTGQLEETILLYVKNHQIPREMGVQYMKFITNGLIHAGKASFIASLVLKRMDYISVKVTTNHGSSSGTTS